MIEDRNQAIENDKKRKTLKVEIDQFQVRPLSGILENRYFDMLESEAIEPEDIENDIADLEMDVDVAIAKLEEFRSKCVSLTREYL